MVPLTALFDQTIFATHYYADIYAPTPLSGTFTYTWTLTLQLVDPSGAPDPTTPGSGAAVDVGCTNAGVGTPDPFVDTKPTSYVEYRSDASIPEGMNVLDDAFIWFHPDPADSNPPGKYGCDHLDQGPSGHQGLITATVSDGIYKCTATYKGTNSDTADSVKNGTASQPVCTKM
jgi:hypothetical protein